MAQTFNQPLTGTGKGGLSQGVTSFLCGAGICMLAISLVPKIILKLTTAPKKQGGLKKFQFATEETLRDASEKVVDDLVDQSAANVVNNLVGGGAKG